MCRRTIVLGLGNLLCSDEGFGIHAVQKLEALHNNATEIEFIDGGVLGLDLLPLVESCTRLLLLDAVNAGLNPGTLVELAKKEIPLYAGIKLSEHQVSFQEVLGLAKVRNHYPDHLHLIGVQPTQISLGVELSPEVSATLPQVIQRAGSVLAEWGNN